MTLQETYIEVKKSIIAFTLKNITVPSNRLPPQYPTIIGTGFIAREDGIIVTNDHVIRSLLKLIKKVNETEYDIGIKAVIYHIDEEIGLLEIPLEIIQIYIIDEYIKPSPNYGFPAPDIGFVRVKAKNLPFLKISTAISFNEGKEIATAGFPMGTDALMAPGWLHQISPTLQKGIISAILPFSCENPHRFVINVMTQGGASGSPVFDPENGEVIGVLYAGLIEFGSIDNLKYDKPTNISYVVPSHYIIKLLNDADINVDFALPDDTPRFEDILKNKARFNALEKSRWNLISNEIVFNKLT